MLFYQDILYILISYGKKTFFWLSYPPQKKRTGIYHLFEKYAEGLLFMGENGKKRLRILQ
jgi:hypothetical protein